MLSFLRFTYYFVSLYKHPLYEFQSLRYCHLLVFFFVRIRCVLVDILRFGSFIVL